MNDETEREREAFEVWALGEGFRLERARAAYRDEPTDTAWSGWRAARAAQAAEAPAGWKLVPVEPTIAMCIAGDEARMTIDDPTRTASIFREMVSAAPTPPNIRAAEAEEALTDPVKAQGMPPLPDMVIVGYGADPEGNTWDVEAFTADHMYAYAQAYGDARAAAERERCAKVVEEFLGRQGRKEIASAIRAAAQEGKQP